MFAATQFAEFAHSPEALPNSARKAAIRTVFDLLTAAIAGHPTPGAQAARRAALQFWGPGTAACWFSDARLAMAGAAFANSAASSMLDLDDGHRAAAGHPGASVIPAVLAHADAHDSWRRPDPDRDRARLRDRHPYQCRARFQDARDDGDRPLVRTGRGRRHRISARPTERKHRPCDRDRRNDGAMFGACCLYAIHGQHGQGRHPRSDRQRHSRR